jgi:hypothetical protein
LQVRLDEAEANALKGGKRIIQKLEQRVIVLFIFIRCINTYFNLILIFFNQDPRTRIRIRFRAKTSSRNFEGSQKER